MSDNVRETALDEVVRMCIGWVRTSKESQSLAYTELQRLRAAAAERDELKAKADIKIEDVSALDYCVSWRGTLDAKEQKRARVELAALIAERDAMCATIAQQAERIAALEAAVNEAREILIVLLHMQQYTGKQLLDTWDRADDWIIARATAQEAERTT